MVGGKKHKRSDVSVKAPVEIFVPRGSSGGPQLLLYFLLAGTIEHVKTHSPFSGA